MKARLVVTAILVHAVEHEAVEVDVENERITEALREGDGTAAWLGDSKLMPRATTGVKAMTCTSGPGFSLMMERP